MDGSGAQASPDVQALVSSLHERLVANGGWNKLLKQLRSGLEGSAWETDLSGYAREQATERGGDIHLNEMVELLQPQAKDTIPSDLKEQLLKTIQTFVEANIED